MVSAHPPLVRLLLGSVTAAGAPGGPRAPFLAEEGREEVEKAPVPSGSGPRRGQPGCQLPAVGKNESPSVTVYSKENSENKAIIQLKQVS